MISRQMYITCVLEEVSSEEIEETKRSDDSQMEEESDLVIWLIWATEVSYML